MTPLDFIFWAIEFLLEGFGAEYAFKRKTWPLFAYLIFRFWADFIGFIVFFAYGQDAFYWCDWWQRAVQYPLMAVLIVYAIGNVLTENNPDTIKEYAAMLVGVAIIVAVLFRFSRTPITSTILMRAAFVANMFLCSVLCFALAMRKEVKAPWGAISAGILIQVGSEALLTLGLLHGIDTSRLYPLGAIAALGMWVWAVRPKFQVSAARLGIGARGFGR